MYNKNKFHITGLGICLAAAMLVGCGELEETADKTVNNIEDVVQSAATSMDPNVTKVKEGYLDSYPNIAIGEAFESYFSSPAWKYFPAEEEEEVVEFTGYFMFEEVKAKATIQFVMQEEGQFEIGATTFNDLPQDQLSKGNLIESIFEEAALENTEMVNGTEDSAEEQAEDIESMDDETTDDGETIDMPFPTGVSLDVLTEHYGEVTYDDYFLGGRLVVFEDEDGYFLNENENVTGYMISNPYRPIYNAYIGMTLSEVANAFSEPYDPIYDDTETQSYVSLYEIDQYKISFYADTEDGPTTSAIVIDNSKIEVSEDISDDPYEWTPGFQEHFEEEILEREYVDSLDTIRYERAYVENGEGYLQLYGEMGGTEYPIVKVNVKTGDFTGL